MSGVNGFNSSEDFLFDEIPYFLIHEIDDNIAINDIVVLPIPPGYEVTGTMVLIFTNTDHAYHYLSNVGVGAFDVRPTRVKTLEALIHMLGLLQQEGITHVTINPTILTAESVKVSLIGIGKLINQFNKDRS